MAFVDSNSTDNDATVLVPTGSSGDILVAFTFDCTGTAPAGFTQRDSALTVGGFSIRMWTKTRAAETSGVSTVAFTSGGTYPIVHLLDLSGVNEVPVFAHATATGVATIDGPSVSPSAAATLCFYIYSLNELFTGANPSGMTRREEVPADTESWTAEVSSGATGTRSRTTVTNTDIGAFMAAFETAGGPTVTVQPTSAHVLSGTTANFTANVTAGGGGTVTWKAQSNGVDIGGATGSGTSASYTTGTLAPSDDNKIITFVFAETGGTLPGSVTTSGATLRVGVIFLAAGAAAYSTAGGGTVAPAYPTVSGGIAAGDQLVTFVALKPPTASPNTGTVTTPTTGGTWNRPAELTAANDGNTGGYTTTIASDTGNVGAFSFDLLATGGESGTMSITLGGTGSTGNTASVAWAVMMAFRKPPGSTWSTVVGSTGKQTSAPGGGVVSQAMAADPGVTAGDYVAFMMAIPTDVNGGTTWASQAVTQSGVTYETALETAEPFSANGSDIGGFVAITRALTGTSGGVQTVAGTKGGTTTGGRGPLLALRFRATASSPPATKPRRALLGVGS